MTPFEPTQGDSFAAGLFQGRPGAYAARDVYVAIAADESANGPDGVVTVRVIFCSAGYHGDHQAEVHDVTLTGTQEQTVRPTSLIGEICVRVEHLSGGTYYGRAYEEFVG